MPGDGPAIETRRLLLRPLGAGDLDETHALWTQPDVRRFLFDDEVILEEKALELLRRSERDFEERGYGLWGVRRRGSESLIGFCGLLRDEETGEAELLYGLSREVWGGGLATEAALAVIRHGFERAGLSRVVASADAGNVASVRVMERLGMGFWRREVREGGDLVHYAVRPFSASRG